MVLIRVSVDAWTLGRIYVTVVQVVLLYDSETRVTTPIIGRLLGGFHQGVTNSMTGQQLRIGRGGGWMYYPAGRSNGGGMVTRGG